MDEGEFLTEVEKKRFLRCCMRPAKYFICKGCSLRDSVILALGTDLLFSLIRVIDTFGILLDIITWYKWWVVYYILAWFLIGVGCLVCGVFGVIGIVKQSTRKLKIYSVFK
jgi:hypothetical protein